MYRVDFAAEPDKARTSINDWIDEQTDGQLAQFLPPQAVDSSTRLLLANTVHFKADWAACENLSSNFKYLLDIFRLYL